MHRLLRTGDFWAGLAFAALGAWIVGQARQWVYLGEEGPGAGFFPMWYGIAMLVLSLALVVGAARRQGEAGRPLREQWKGTGRALACWGALAVSVALLKLVGFIVSFALLAWFITAILCRKRALLSIGLSVAWAVFFWAVFSWGLDMSLPAGRFF